MITARIVIDLLPGFDSRKCRYFVINTLSILPNGYARFLSPVAK